MRQKTQGVSLQAVLDHVFADQVRRSGTGCASANGASAAVPATRTSEDRSRMRQRVIEELARRKQAREDAETPTVDSKIVPDATATRTHESLFPTDASAGDERLSAPQSFYAFATPRISNRKCGDVRGLVARAYESLSRCVPEDHVLVDPAVNGEFIARCKLLGADVSEVLLNRTLLNNRKAKRHCGILREYVMGLEHGVYDQIGHAVEIAASLVQREWYATGRILPSVDDILCTPELRQAFKTYVTTLHANADIVNCHMVLLAYRKSGRESAQRLASVDVPDALFTAPIQSLDPADVPESCGVYRVLCKRKPIFVSGTANLRQRISKHIAAVKGAFLPAGLPFSVDGPVSVQVFAGPTGWLPRRADAVARSMRIDEYPDLNWREKGALFAEQTRVVARCAAVG